MLKKIAPFLVALCGIVRSSDLYFRNNMILAIPIPVLIAWEHLINLILVAPVLFFKRRFFKKINFVDFILFLLIGVGASALGVLCFTKAFTFINPALAVLLQKLQPIFTIGLSLLLLRERPPFSFFIWAIAAIISSYFVSFGLTNPFSAQGKELFYGALYATLAAFLWGSGTVWGKILLKKYDQSFVLSMRFLIGAIFTISLAFFINGSLLVEKVFDEHNFLFTNIFYMAIISGLIATTFFYFGLSKVKASWAAILELFFPLSSVLIMWISFNRPLSLIQITAGVLLFISVYKAGQKC